MDLRHRTVLVDTDLTLPEGPRWHNNRLWFADMFSGRIIAVDMDGKTEVVVQQADKWLSGLGWLPDGQLLVVSMTDRRLYRLEANGLVEAVNLEAVTTMHTNDMVVDFQGRAYIGEVGYDVHGGETFKPAKLVMVMPDGQTTTVDADLAVPNGTVITEDGSTLIVAESMAARLTAFDIQDDGSLTNKKVWAEMEGCTPDGICLDAENGIWVASPTTMEVIRVLKGGEVTHRFNTNPMPVACMLGGPKRNLLFICECKPPKEIFPNFDSGFGDLSSRIEYVEVDVPGAGLP